MKRKISGGILILIGIIILILNLGAVKNYAHEVTVKLLYKNKMYDKIYNDEKTKEYFIKGNSHVKVTENSQGQEKDLKPALENYKLALKTSEDVNIKKNYEIVLQKEKEQEQKNKDNKDNKDDKNKQDKNDKNENKDQDKNQDNKKQNQDKKDENQKQEQKQNQDQKQSQQQKQQQQKQEEQKKSERDFVLKKLEGDESKTFKANEKNQAQMMMGSQNNQQETKNRNNW